MSRRNSQAASGMVPSRGRPSGRSLKTPTPATQFMTARAPIAFHRRIIALDLARGLVMILMALDHTRDYFSQTNFDPLDLARTTPALFFIR